MRVVQPIVEYENSPLGIETPSPRFSWILESDKRDDRQSAYRILVSSTVALLNQNVGDKWDSGQVASTDTVNIPYAGDGIESGEQCCWKVMCWDNGEVPGAWSEASTFEMGLLKKSDWQGSWICGGKGVSSPLFRDEFDIPSEVARARLYICGIGWHEAYVNGDKIGDHEFDPAPTWYDNIFPFEIQSRVLYVAHDITEMLHSGRNAIGAMLGHGWYSSDTGDPAGRISIGQQPILIAQVNIDLADGSRMCLFTNDTWQTHSGPIETNDLYSGESYDARQETDGWKLPGFGTDWKRASLAEPPSGRLVSQSVEPERVTRRFDAARKLQSGEDRWIFDFGQFISGWVELKVTGPRGTKIGLRYAGRVNYETTSLDTRNTDYGERIHLDFSLTGGLGDSYTLKGEGIEMWHPRFTVHGFRYVEVIGYPGAPALNAVAGCAVNSDVPAVGEFSCSHDLFNRIHHNVWWTFLGSFQGIPQDAADRAERCGWLGDPGFVAEDYMYNFRDIRFWSKWLEDIADTQRADGSVSYIAPPNWGESSFRVWPCWECAYTLFVWHCYDFYDDRRLLENHYEGVKKQVVYFQRQAKGLILNDGLGDHMEPSHSVFSNPAPVDTPREVCGTAYFYRCVWILSRMAEITGRQSDAGEFSALAESIKEAFIEAFFDPDTCQVSSGSQTANALALYFDLLPENNRDKVLDNLIADIEEKKGGHLKTGIIGTDALEQVLPAHGRADVMYEIASKTTFPSWGYGVVNGQTTIAEEFGCSHLYSVSMKMFGSIEKFFYKDVAGICPSSPGFRTLLIHPKLVGTISSARAVIDSIRGKASVEWSVDHDGLSMRLAVPPGVDAEVRLPTVGLSNPAISEGGKPIWEAGAFIPGAPGISKGVSQEDQTVSLSVGSGTYEFFVSGSRS